MIIYHFLILLVSTSAGYVCTSALTFHRPGWKSRLWKLLYKRLAALWPWLEDAAILVVTFLVVLSYFVALVLILDWV